MRCLAGFLSACAMAALATVAASAQDVADLTPEQAAAHENLVTLAGDLFEGDAIDVFLCIVHEASPAELASLAEAEAVAALNPTLTPILPREGLQVCISDLQQQLGLTE